MGATCVSSPGTGFICVCPLGSHGLFCEEGKSCIYNKLTESLINIPQNVSDAIRLQYNIKLRGINLLSPRCYPSAASLLGSRPRFRVVYCLRRVDFDKRHNGVEAATHPAYIRSNLPDSLHRTERFASRCFGPSLDNIRARLYYAHVGFRLR